MKDEITRIMRLVREGKLTPEDAAELIDAMNDAPEEPVAAASGAGQAASGTETAQGGEGAAKTDSDDPFSKLIGAIEKLGRDVSKNVDWNDIGTQIRQGVNKGADAVKAAAEEARKSGRFGLFSGPGKTRIVELPVHVPAGKTLRIEGASGDIRVEGGHDVGSVKITATFRARNEADAEHNAELYVPAIEESEEQVVLRQPDLPGMTADVVFRVPVGVACDIRSASGDVRVQGTKAGARVNSGSGDVVLSDVGGALEAIVSSGDVRLEDANATIVTLETKSGDVRLDRVSGVITVRTASGDVSGSECRPKSLNVEAASGDVNLDVSQPVTGSVNVRTVSGDVLLAVPDNCDCRVNLSALRGEVGTNLELEDLNQTQHKLTGRLGQGAGTLDASTVNGSVRLNQRYTFAKEAASGSASGTTST
ncbi:MAG: DUF4097 family beta strand repeat protein [Fimbriimonadaceae bacterium]|nr:DUF4097 family beta strand repeat protein [Fimbriimonadaceae bacterium]QYK55462.1 MAG: DUF4097 family beta strand repeat protein [Fimbriimonadaceae bacterium]